MSILRNYKICESCPELDKWSGGDGTPFFAYGKYHYYYHCKCATKSVENGGVKDEISSNSDFSFYRQVVPPACVRLMEHEVMAEKAPKNPPMTVLACWQPQDDYK